MERYHDLSRHISFSDGYHAALSIQILTYHATPPLMNTQHQFDFELDEPDAANARSMDMRVLFVSLTSLGYVRVFFLETGNGFGLPCLHKLDEIEHAYAQ